MYGYFLLTTSIVANRACNLVIMLKPYKKRDILLHPYHMAHILFFTDF